MILILQELECLDLPHLYRLCSAFRGVEGGLEARNAGSLLERPDLCKRHAFNKYFMYLTLPLAQLVEPSEH